MVWFYWLITMKFSDEMWHFCNCEMILMEITFCINRYHMAQHSMTSLYRPPLYKDHLTIKSTSQIGCQCGVGSYERIVIWVRSRNCGCLVTWFCYQLIAKLGNKTATVSWPDPYTLRWKCHFDEIFITGCTGRWHFDNFCCSQWWKFCQNDISISVALYQITLGPLRLEGIVNPAPSVCSSVCLT